MALIKKILLVSILPLLLLLAGYPLLYSPVKGDAQHEYFQNITGIYTSIYTSGDVIPGLLPTIHWPQRLNVKHPRTFEIIQAGGQWGNVNGLTVHMIGKDKEYVYIRDGQRFRLVEGSAPDKLKFKDGFFQDGRFAYIHNLVLPLEPLLSSSFYLMPYFNLYKDDTGVYLNFVDRQKVDLADIPSFQAIIPSFNTPDLQGEEVTIFFEDKNFLYTVKNNSLLTIAAVKPFAKEHFVSVGCDYFRFHGQFYHNTHRSDAPLENQEALSCARK